MDIGALAVGSSGRVDRGSEPTPHRTGGAGGGRLCRSTVHGDLRLSGSHDDLELASSWQEPCWTTIHGSAFATDNTADVRLGHLSVRGDLVCTGNTGPRGVVRVGTASVEGARSGQCA